MKKGQASVTAQGIAFVRVVESSKPEEERICYDPLARRLISPVFYWLGKLSINANCPRTSPMCRSISTPRRWKSSLILVTAGRARR